LNRASADARRAEAQIELISQLKPDVFLMQEAKGFEASGYALLFAIGARIGMRGFLAAAPRTGQNVAVFIRDHLTPLAFEGGGNNFHHVLATLRVALPGSTKAITFISALLCPNGPAVRRREAAYLGIQACTRCSRLARGRLRLGVAT
jgi:hypothetical protein